MKKIIIILFFLQLFSYKTNAQVVLPDSLALVDFYNATNGPAWTNSTNWLVGPVKNWFGIYVDAFDSTRVGSIHLSNNNLSGYIPASIGDLTDISVIEIHHNNLSGTIPQTIGRLNKLLIFIVSYNQMSGNISDSICKMTNLSSLHLQYNNFTGKIPDSLNQLLNLNILYIQHNQFDGLPDFSGIPDPGGFMLEVDNNLLTFKDIEPNMTVLSFACSWCDTFYAPQLDSINNPIDTTLQLDSMFSMHCTIGGQHNFYQWSHDSTDIIGATDSVYTINQAAALDSGMYSCRVTNSVVPGLTFYRRPITVHIDKFSGSIADYAEQNNELKIFPNPNNGDMNISYEIPTEETGVLNVYDLLGNTLLSYPLYGGRNSFAITNTTLTQGIYYYRAISGNKQIAADKIVVIK
jgi:hypothetical protein